MNVKEIVASVFSIAVKIIVGVIVVMFIYKYAVIAYDYGYRVFSEPPVAVGDGRTITVTIGDDTTVKEIGESLENKGLIRDGKLFILQELVSENHGEITAGKYDLNTNMTAEEMIKIMAGKDTETTDEEEVMDNPFAEEDGLEAIEDEEIVNPEDQVGAEGESDNGAVGDDNGTVGEGGE